jgi:hypothetical protein
LRKKLTVIGIIGNTQGVNIAASPAAKAIQKIFHNESCGNSPFDVVSLVMIGAAILESVVFFDSATLESSIGDSVAISCCSSLSFFFERWMPALQVC